MQTCQNENELSIVHVIISHGAEGPGREILQRPRPSVCPSVCLSICLSHLVFAL